MNEIKSFLLVLTLVFAQSSYSDPVSGSAQAAQLAELVRQTKIQLEEMQKQLSVMENLKEIQQGELVPYLSGTGDSFGQMFGDIRSIERGVDGWVEDPAGTRQIENDLMRLERTYNQTGDMRAVDEGATYASMMSSLSRLKWLGKAQSDNEKKMAEGMSKKDIEDIAAEAAITTNRILLEQEMARQRREVIGNEIFMKSLDNLNYGQMGLMQ